MVLLGPFNSDVKICMKIKYFFNFLEETIQGSKYENSVRLFMKVGTKKNIIQEPLYFKYGILPGTNNMLETGLVTRTPKKLKLRNYGLLTENFPTFLSKCCPSLL